MAQRPGDVWAEQAGTVRVVMLRGEHDVSTVMRLEAALADAIAGGDGVVVDLTVCSFIDSGSVAALLTAGQIGPVGRFAVVIKPGSEAARLLDLVAFSAVLPVYETRAAALVAVTGG
jgi:anti-anti-sigma factor